MHRYDRHGGTVGRVVRGLSGRHAGPRVASVWSGDSGESDCQGAVPGGHSRGERVACACDGAGWTGRVSGGSIGRVVLGAGGGREGAEGCGVAWEGLLFFSTRPDNDGLTSNKPPPPLGGR